LLIPIPDQYLASTVRHGSKPIFPAQLKERTGDEPNKEQVTGNKARGFWWFQAFIVNYEVAFEGDKLSLGALTMFFIQIIIF